VEKTRGKKGHLEEKTVQIAVLRLVGKSTVFTGLPGVAVRELGQTAWGFTQAGYSVKFDHNVPN
jgi:hypothetical protein